MDGPTLGGPLLEGAARPGLVLPSRGAFSCRRVGGNVAFKAFRSGRVGASVWVGSDPSVPIQAASACFGAPVGAGAVSQFLGPVRAAGRPSRHFSPENPQWLHSRRRENAPTRSVSSLRASLTRPGGASGMGKIALRPAHPPDGEREQRGRRHRGDANAGEPVEQGGGVRQSPPCGVAQVGQGEKG